MPAGRKDAKTAEGDVSSCGARLCLRRVNHLANRRPRRQHILPLSAAGSGRMCRPFGIPLGTICLYGKAGPYPSPATSYGRSGGRLSPSPHQIVSPRSAPRSRCQKSEVRFQSFPPKADAHFWFCALFRRSTNPAHGILWQRQRFCSAACCGPQSPKER